MARNAKAVEETEQAPKAEETEQAPKAEETEQATQAPYDPWTDMRDVNLPRAGMNERNYVFVSVNGHGMQVPRGKSCTVPFPIYERLKICEEMQQAEYELMKAMDGKNVNIGDAAQGVD